MTRKFTLSSLGCILFFFIFSLNLQEVRAQSCAVPNSISTTNISNFTATANWNNNSSADHYRIRYKASPYTGQWFYIQNIPGPTSHVIEGDLIPLTANTSYIWQVKAHCATDNSNPSGWSVRDTFMTTNHWVDCFNTPLLEINPYDGLYPTTPQ